MSNTCGYGWRGGLLATLLILFTLSVPGAAGGADTPSDSTGAQRTRSTTILPFASYTPETGVAGGLGLGYFFRDAEAHRPNSISGAGFYTANSQIVLGFQSEIYSGDA